MKLIKVKNKKELGERAGAIVAEAVKAMPYIVLGLPTGSSPMPVYEDLILRYQKGDIDFSRVSTINLDEYIGLPATHTQSYHYYMDETFFSHVNTDPARTHLPDGAAEDPEAECKKYDELIDKLSGVDLQLLGIGYNGHIGFNEPSDSFSKRTSVVRLTEDTVKANSRFFDDAAGVPEYAISMGIRDIMLARKIILVAGEEKKDIVDIAVNGDITPRVPASALQLHRDATVILIQG